MTQTVLQIAQSALTREGLFQNISSIATPVSNVEKQIAAIFNVTGKHLAHEAFWPQLTKLAWFPMVENQINYSLPADFLAPHTDTFWDISSRWPTRGPMSPREWTTRKFGWVSSAPYRRYRIMGSSTSGTFMLEYTPTSSDAGNYIAFEYISSSWIRPASAWANGVAYTTSSYVYINETPDVSDDVTLPSQLMIIKAGSAATSGGTTPSQSNSYSDGTITWTPYAYETILSDTDVVLLDEELFALGIIWRYLRALGRPYQEKKEEYDEHVREHVAFARSARAFSMATNDVIPLIDYYNIKDTGVGI